MLSTPSSSSSSTPKEANRLGEAILDIFFLPVSCYLSLSPIVFNESPSLGVLDEQDFEIVSPRAPLPSFKPILGALVDGTKRVDVNTTAQDATVGQSSDGDSRVGFLVEEPMRTPVSFATEVEGVSKTQAENDDCTTSKNMGGVLF
nr:hypothetical protein [Tanacetum cinerariifolium]